MTVKIMPMDQKRHLEVGCTSGILRCILICEVNNKVWTQGQNEVPLRRKLFSMRRLMWMWIKLPEWDLKETYLYYRENLHMTHCQSPARTLWDPSPLSTIKNHLQTNLQLHQSTSTGTESINDIPGLTCHAKLMQRNLYQTAGGWIIALLLR